MCLKTDIIDIYMKCMLLFPIMTVLPDRGIVTKILFACLIFCPIWVCIKHGLKKRH